MSMTGAAAAALVMAIAGAPGQARADLPGCAPLTSDDVEILFDRWNKALMTRHPDKVTRNYAPDAVLLATGSNLPRTNYAEIRDYYMYFLQREPVARVESRNVRLGCNIALDMGTYSFTVKGRAEGTVETLAARYTFIYERREGAWLITHHHSSIMPERGLPVAGVPIPATPSAPLAPKPSEPAAKAANAPQPAVASFVKRNAAPKSVAPPAAASGYKAGSWSDNEPRF
jgi:uncharacterized protein (TIGR02246 family)